MNIPVLRAIGLYIMLLSMMLAVFRQEELLVYGIFFVGFFMAILPTDIRKIPPQAILTVIIPIIALQLQIALPQRIPGLIRLGIVISLWTITLITTVWVISIVLKKWGHNNTRQTPK